MPSDRNVVSAKLEPTLRSMPPASMTIVMPSTTSISSPSWRALSLSPPTVRKSGTTYEKNATAMIRIATGIALSIQFLERISPST